MTISKFILNKYSKYQEDFYIDNNKLYCILCKHIINYSRKSILNNHLKSKNHKNKKQNLTTNQETIIFSSSSEKQEINYDLVKVFAAADIPLEKIEKLHSFFFKYCKNGKILKNFIKL